MKQFKKINYWICACSLFLATQSNAQLISGDVFLQGSYVEVGIATNGAYGSGGNAPSGYHPKGVSGIGFVADPAKDGWSVGSPNYFGDYFLPGSPQEGWDVSFEGSSSSAWRGSGPTSMTGGLTGSNTSYSTVGTKKIGVWNGSKGDLQITQTTTLRTDKLYFVVNVELYNSGTTTLHNLYYNRSVDPDNEQTITGDFTTHNKIIFKLPSSTGNKTLVTATGTTYTNAYLGLGTKDCRAKPYIMNSGLTPITDMAALYNGTGGATSYIYDTSLFTSDVGMGVIFKLDSLEPGEGTSVALAYILREIDLDSAFEEIAPRWRYRGNSYNSGDTIHPCKGSTIDLRVENAGYYDSWTWTPTTGLSDPTSSANVVIVGTSNISYTATGTSSFCPGSSITTTLHLVPVDGPLAPVVSSPVNLCRGVTATALTASPTTGLVWYSSASGLTPLPAAPIPSTSSVGTTSFWVATDNGSCEGPRSKMDVIVAKYPNPTITSPQKLCVGDGSVSLGGVTGTNLKWYSSASGGVGSSAAPVVSTSGTGTYKFYVSQSSGVAGCESDRDSITAIVNVKPDVDISLDGLTPKSTYCFRTGMTLKAESSVAAASFKWFYEGVLMSGSTADTIIPATAGNYSVSVKDINGCSDTAMVMVYRDTLPRPSLSPKDIYTCPGVVVRLYCAPMLSGYSFDWQKDGVSFSGPKEDERDASAPGVYIVKVSEPGGCQFYSNAISVTHYTMPSKPTVVRLDPLLQVSGTFAKYQWYRNNKIISGATNKLHSYSFDGKYFAQVWDVNDCSQYTDTVMVNSLSVGHSNTAQTLSIYPNPTKDLLNVDCAFEPDLSISDLSGRTILQAKQSHQINLQALASGMYLLRISNSETPDQVHYYKIEKLPTE